jgi:predicted GNAT superfamily acetyltransferase
VTDSIDLAAVLALNAAHETETSPLDAASLQALLDAAFHVGLVERGREAFLIAFDQAAPYACPNFVWFQARYARFVYVDRIIVDAAARGRGHARTLYRELFDAAAAAGHTIITCEVNLVPPNPGSDAFHAALGFEEVGRGAPDGTDKRVRYLVHRL